MELEHRIGQLIFIGLSGQRLDSQLQDMLTAIQPGGVLLRDEDLEGAAQVMELTSQIRSLIKVPPLIAIDQEGGSVDRLSRIYQPMPSADLLRRSNDASLAARLGEITAEALRLLGFNINFAPVLDIAFDDSADNGLRGRYLGDTAAGVVRLAGAYLEGLQRGGVVGVGKHFPGLGAARSNPRQTLPSIDRPRDLMAKQELLPYAELFNKLNARLNAIIVANAHYEAFDGPAPLPASLSKNIMQGLLREELGFKGMAITDDLALPSIMRDLAEASLAAIEAGADMITICAPPEDTFRAWRALVEAANQGRITRQRISRSFDNIARVKAMIWPPIPITDMAVSRLKERIAELNLLVQRSC
jgi:beta-N-acetylhexosaminidase